MPNFLLYLNAEEEKKFRELLDENSTTSASAFIKKKIFQGRDRNKKLPIPKAEIILIAQLSSFVSSIIDDYKNNRDISEDLGELEKLINENLQRS